MPWLDLKLPAFVTGPVTGSTEPAPSPEEQVRRLLKVSEWDPRPVLLYFHFPHDEDVKPTAEGKLSKKQCGELIEEEFSRWGILCRCYEVDMATSDKAFAEKVGCSGGTGFALINGKGEPFAKAGTFSTPTAIRDWLKKSLQEGAPVYWDAIQKQVAEQKALLDEARKLAKAEQWKAAKQKYDEIRGSTLRIGDYWDDAAKEGIKVDEKAKKA